MKNLVVAVLLLLCSVLAWSYFSASSELKLDAELTLKVALRSSIAEVVNATGVIKARNGAEVRVGSRISGVLEQVHVDVGDAVEAGQLLAELDDQELESELLLLQARCRELQVQLEFSQLLLERNQSANILPATELAALRKEVALNEARLLQAHAALQSQLIQLSHTRVLAPISGTIASVSTQQGETIAASFAAPTFMTVIDLSRLEIQAYVDEADIGRITPGQPVGFRVDTWLEVGFTGTVRTIYPKAAVVNNVVNYIVIVDIENSQDYLLRPEMTAHLQFVLQEVKGAITVARTALLNDTEGYFVVVDEEGVLEKKRVELGIVNPALVEIRAGLMEGSRYVANRQQWLDLQSATGE